MNNLIAPENRANLQELFLSLSPGTKPLWGNMQPQQMIEHLAQNVVYTNGKKITVCERSPEEALKRKQVMIYTDVAIPKNIILETLPATCAHADIPAAVHQLMAELADFDQYFNEPGITSIHSGFGPMDHNEWLIWHSKHFKHHLVQFGLMEGLTVDKEP